MLVKVGMKLIETNEINNVHTYTEGLINFTTHFARPIKNN